MRLALALAVFVAGCGQAPAPDAPVWPCHDPRDLGRVTWKKPGAGPGSLSVDLRECQNGDACMRVRGWALVPVNDCWKS